MGMSSNDHRQLLGLRNRVPVFGLGEYSADVFGGKKLFFGYRAGHDADIDVCISVCFRKVIQLILLYR